jgi:predicted Ser/Thr protein kinase
MTNLEKNQEVLEVLNNLKRTGKVVVEVQKVFETNYRTGSLEEALKRQVVTETIHQLEVVEEDNRCENDFDKKEQISASVPTQRVKIVIIGLDNHDTIKRKCEIAQEHLAEINRGEQFRKNLQSENLFEFLEANLSLEVSQNSMLSE